MIGTYEIGRHSFFYHIRGRPRLRRDGQRDLMANNRLREVQITYLLSEIERI